MKTSLLKLVSSKEKRVEKKGKKKKHLRKYVIQDRIRFKRGFDRFWFFFIYPNSDLSSEEILEIVELNFDRFVSIAFEEVAKEVVRKVYRVEFCQSYWDRKVEFDIFGRFYDDSYIIGETKWKRSKISKNTYIKLLKKIELVDFVARKVALFSRNGFSKELMSLKDERLDIYDLKRVAEVIGD
jgi:hypothetical protein